MARAGQGKSVRLVGLACGLVAAWFGCGAPRPAAADWPPEGRGVIVAPEAQVHAVAAPDGAGGAVVAWQDDRSERASVRVGHVLAAGALDPAWPAGGLPVVGDSLALGDIEKGQILPAIVADGAGGAIVVWEDNRDPATAIDVYAQHVLADGALDPAWPVNGRALCTAPGAQTALVAASDDLGGAFVAWTDARAGVDQGDIYAQHVRADGALDPAWPANGAAVCGAAGAQVAPALAADGRGGAVVAWQDGRAGADGTGLDIDAQHLLGAGGAAIDPAWPADGRAVCAAAGDQGGPTVTRDGAGGAIVAWTDLRLAGTSHVFAQHVLASGAVDAGWPPDGRALSGANVLETRPLAVPDGAGGALVVWQGFTVVLNQYAQRVRANGTLDPAWPAAGRALSSRERQQTHARVAEDGAGGAVVAWQDSFDIVAQHVRVDGTLDPAYPDTGRAVCYLPSQQSDPSLVATGGGDAIVTWSDSRSGVSVDIFAMQVASAGVTGVGDREPDPSTGARVALAPPAPSPARGAVSLRFTLPRAGRVALGIYDPRGGRVRTLVAEALAAGGHVAAWDGMDAGGRAAPAGVYLARLEAAGSTAVRKLVRLR